MKRSNVNVIIDNAINSQDYYRMYSSRDFYRGTSFKMAGAWTPDTHYFNDEHIIDFISCEGALLYCLRGHLSSEWNKPNLIYKDDIIVGVESNPYWAFIMGNSGKGQKGDKGDIGPIGPSGTDGITPQLKIEDGRWLLSMDKGQTWQDIGQATGDPGQNGTDGKNGSDGIGVIPGGTTGQALVKKSNADYDTEWKTISEGGEIPNFDAEVVNVSSTTQANANVVLERDIFKFSFGLPKGADGKDGKDGTNGTDGIPGTPGEDGRTTYFHIKYSAVANPTSSSQMTETPSTYIGTYVDFTQADSTDPSDYTWARFEGIQGEKGEQGIPGTNGEDGKTSYLHIKYSNDGGVTFTGNNGEDPGAWIGIYVDYNINDSDDPSDYKWTKIKGEPGITGDPGPAGKDGVDGLPGIGIEVRYCLGTTTIYGGTSTPGTTRQPTGWNLAVPTPTEETPYIWFIQARVNYTSNTDKVGTIEGSWSTPTKLSGTNGLNGENGSKGQIIYPEGIYNVNTVYQGTADKTPYVYDSNDASYYVLNIVGTWQGTLHSNESPSTDTSNSWVKLDAFEALYTKIGIIANGLIGSAVFNGNYMFSQQGIDASGQISTQYQNFDPEIPTGGEFTPNILFDFRTGAGHMAAGKIKFGSDGSVDLTNIKINNAIIQNIKQYSLTQSSDPHILDSLYSEIIYSPTIHEDVTLKVNASEYQLNIDDSYSGVIHNKSDKQLFIYPFDNGNDDESIKICGYYNGRLLFSYDEPILFNASQILLPAGGVLEFKFVPSSIVNNYYVGTIWVENTSDFELKTWKQNGTLRSDLYYKSYDDYNSDSFLACGEVYFNSSGVPSLSSFSRCRTDLVLTVSQSGSFSANLDLTSIYNGRTLSISTIAFSQPIWDGAMLKMFYGSARSRINGAFLDVRTADGKVPTTSISVPFLILGSK